MRFHGLLIVLSSLLGMPNSALCEQDLAFNRDIRPLLSDKCFLCHGPADTKGDLRLDRREDALSVITPGHIAQSELIKRITHPDPEERMPPSDSGRTLTAPEIELLKRWITDGAPWQKHWAYIPPVRPQPPTVNNPTWPQNAIDPFPLNRLEREGLTPSAPASREILIRRVSFDLTGLPPTPEEIDAFLADQRPEAFEHVVDRLLASPRFGERMAMTWLDAARYADTHGYSLDRRRVMWPWRDWVIQAFNQNMPFDQFVIEQLAGDLLPHATRSQILATGFNRNHSIQSEGGVINEEYRVETVIDRVETTAAVFLGQTFGCARCHDHKYDPLSQKEFYQFFAFFNNVPETAHVGNKDKDVDPPVVLAPTLGQQKQRMELEREITRLEKAAEQAPVVAPGDMERVWIDDAIPPGTQALGNGGGAQAFEFVSAPHPVFSGKNSSMRKSTGRGQHLVHSAQSGMPLGENARLFCYVYLDPVDPPKQIMLQWHDGGGWEHRAVWGGDHIPWGTAGTISRHNMGALPEFGKWIRLEVEAAKVGLRANSMLNGWAFTQFDGTVYWDKAGIVSRVASPTEHQLYTARQQLASLEKGFVQTMVMGDMPTPRKAFVLHRGEYDKPTEERVHPALPEFLGSLPPSETTNRLTLARWMVSEENPLTARVTVNRFWQMLFGTGLVNSSEDFGSQGEWPSHPELLDWLAVEFMHNGWDVKALLKQIVLSATYQQSSKTTPALSERDPHNRLLARGPRFRLPAEMIRDQALYASGLYVENIGGESVKPYQPPGLWADVVYENAPRFKQDHGEKLYRRSMYTYWKRSVPPPNLTIFDAPTREACVLKRGRTNTPLASLVLMNDPTFVEAARKLGERILRQPVGSRWDFAFRLATSRLPSAHEKQQMQKLYEKQRDIYRSQPEEAKKL
ncbi:MAG: hypothetical protein ACI97B_002134, partial [Verrucomicrobiales bacterium]